MHPELVRLLAIEHINDMLAQADRARLARAAHRPRHVRWRSLRPQPAGSSPSQWRHVVGDPRAERIGHGPLPCQGAWGSDD